MTAAREGERRGKTSQPGPEHDNITPAPGHMSDHPRFPRKRQASRLSIPAHQLHRGELTPGPVIYLRARSRCPSARSSPATPLSFMPPQPGQHVNPHIHAGNGKAGHAQNTPIWTLPQGDRQRASASPPLGPASA